MIVNYERRVWSFQRGANRFYTEGHGEIYLEKAAILERCLAASSVAWYPQKGMGVLEWREPIVFEGSAESSESWEGVYRVALVDNAILGELIEQGVWLEIQFIRNSDPSAQPGGEDGGDEGR